MTGCPRCGGDRLKSAPMPVLSAVLKLFWRKRRYRCADCGTISWHHRLQRRSTALPSLAPSATAGAPAIVFVVIVVGILLSSGIALTRSCAEQRPADVSTVP